MRCCYLVIVGDDMSIVCSLLLWLCNVDPLLSILLLLGPCDFFCGKLWRTWSSGLLELGPFVFCGMRSSCWLGGIQFVRT